MNWEAVRRLWDVVTGSAQDGDVTLNEVGALLILAFYDDGKFGELSPSASSRNQRKDTNRSSLTKSLGRRLLAGVVNVTLQKEKGDSDQPGRRDGRRNQLCFICDNKVACLN